MADVTVLGAGIFGLSVAWSCLKRGAKVQIIDPNGVASGASGGIVGALAPHTPENWNQKKQFQFESLIMAQDYWAEVEEVSNHATGYARLGRLQPIPDARAFELAQTRADLAQTLWQGHADWNVRDITEFADWAPPSASGQLIYDTLSARIHPKRASTALAAAIKSKGGTINTSGRHEGAVVHATGYRGLEGLNTLHSRQVGNGVKGQAILLKYDAAEKPQIFADSLHFIPHADGTVAIGSTSERYFEASTATDKQLDALYQRALTIFPLLRDAEILERWANIRPRARSRAPMLGKHPFNTGEFIANGGFKIGFGMAPKTGEVMADLILNKTDTIPEDFQPQTCL